MKLRDLQADVNLPDLIAELAGGEAVHRLSRERGGEMCDPRPACEERHESFSVYLKGGAWKWKRHGGDEAGGTAYDLLLHFGYSDEQAREKLAQLAGMSLSGQGSVKSRPAPAPRDPLAEARRAAALLAPIQASDPAGVNLAALGLLGWLDANKIRRDFTAPDGRLLAWAGALAFMVRGPDGQPCGLKVRNTGTAEELQAAGLARYVYRIGGHGAPAWCSPGYGQGKALLIVEGELNGAAAARAAEVVGLGLDVQGMAGAGGTPFLEGVAGRPVYLYADPDDAGTACLERVAALVRAADAAEVRILAPLVSGDFCDLAGSDGPAALGARLLDLIAGAAVWEPTAASSAAQAEGAAARPDNEDGKEKRSSASSRVMEYVKADGAELWHDQGGAAYLTATTSGHREHYRLPSTPARDYLQALYYAREQRALNAQAQGEAVALMQALARREGPEHRTAVRVTHLDGCTYLDLGRPDWKAVEVGRGYWKIIGPHDCPVRFTRPGGLLPLPTPENGGNLGELREFLNTDDRGFVMVVAWLLGAVSGLSPYPVLALSGEQGTGKSTAASVARNLLDPHEADRRRTPKEERDLFIAALAAHVLSYDNISSIPGCLSDALCVLSTGGAFTARTLYSDGEETILKAVRPVIVNGIPDLLARPDLAERALTVTLYRIAPHKRTPEKVFWARYERARPRLLGALLTALAEGLRHLDSTHLEHAPRLADFARLIVAAESALPWEPGAFLAAYGQMQSEAAGTVLDGEPVAEALRALVDDGAEWLGTVKALLLTLNEQEGYPDDHRPPQSWPRTPRALGGSLRRLAPALSKTGYMVTPEGRSRDGERYRLAKELESTFTTCTTYTDPRPDDKNVGVLGEKQRTHGAANVHTPEPGVNIGPAGVYIETSEVHLENAVQHGVSVGGVGDARSAPSLGDRANVEPSWDGEEL
ncbi:hypothetical protein GCM10022631_41710 [Deinococcus rubellus]|uniref:Toprim domain-containing protein n=1 Tax=Deinococcus rubellus TaxID=1889240 RepID=A0ABY5YIU7_9DEIO|nr:hypothetical protein [Deinococcus rubellus]UWX65045.1 hypothetical protein N0D28_05150 [Deinococcus rubellus]